MFGFQDNKYKFCGELLLYSQYYIISRIKSGLIINSSYKMFYTLQELNLTY